MTSTGIDKPRNTTERVNDNTIDITKQIIDETKVYNSTSPVFALSGEQSSAEGSAAGNYLSKSGDLRLGPMGNEFTIVGIVDDAINVSNATPNYVPSLILNPEDGEADDLESIVPGTVVFSNQELFLQNGNDLVDITLKDTAGVGVDIITPDGNDLVLTFGVMVKLIFSQLLGGWIVVWISTGGTGGGGSGTPPFQYGLTLIATTTGTATLNLNPNSGAKGQHFIFSNELTGDVDITFTNTPADGFSQPYIIEYELGATVFEVTFNGITDVTPIEGSANAITKLAGYITNNGGLISSNFTMTSTAGTGGGTDASLWANFTAISDVNFGTFDGTNLDRLLFNQAAGDALAAGSTGITSNNVGEMQFNVPDAQEYIWSTDAEIRMRLDQSGTNSDTILTVQTPLTDIAAIPEILINRIDPTPENNTEFGFISFQGSNALSSGSVVIDPHKYSQIAVEYENVVDGREAASMIFTTSFDNGAATLFTPFMILNAANSGNVDFIRDIGMNDNKIIFDDDLDSDTFIQANGSDPDRIDFYGNDVNSFAVSYDTGIAKGQVGIPLGSNTFFSMLDHFMIWNKISEPADGEVGNSQGDVYFDNSTDPPILKIKKKNAAGTIVVVSLEQGGGSGANTALSNLASPTAVSQPINMLGKTLTLDVAKTTNISGFTANQIDFSTDSNLQMSIKTASIDFAIPISMGNASRITNVNNPTNNQDVVTLSYFNSNSVTNPMTEDLVMSDNNITELNDISFDDGGRILSSEASINIDYPDGGICRIRNNLTSRLEITTIVKSLVDLEMDGSTEIDFSTSTTTASAGSQTLPSNPTGFILCRVNGSDARIPFYGT